MFRILIGAGLGMALLSGAAFAEVYEEVTVGVPVASVAEAEEWYRDLLGAEVEVIKPFPGVVEFKIADGVWLQIFEADAQAETKAIVRFKVDDIEKKQGESAEVGIDTGKVITIPEVVTYSEFADPDGNAFGYYELPR